MLPLIPPTTLHELAREYSSFSHHSAASKPAGGGFRTLFAVNPLRALAHRINAWRQSRDERRYGTRIVSRSPGRRPDRTPVAITRRAHDTFRDLDVAA
jgi:hypothetical protein